MFNYEIIKQKIVKMSTVCTHFCNILKFKIIFEVGYGSKMILNFKILLLNLINMFINLLFSIKFSFIYFVYQINKVHNFLEIQMNF